MASTIASLTASTSATATSAGASPSSTVRATPQGGILEGENPSKWDPKNPITVFIIQACIIVIFCRLLHYPLSRLRQPRVIAEVIGGILLGPSVMGRIPGFTAAIFPPASMPSLNLVANIGLVLFLFLVGLEADPRLVRSNWRIALSVGAAGMILPFGLGCAIAYGLYNQFGDEPGLVPISFGVFMLFVGVAMAITAFPVLCRILTELQLLSTSVGIIVLSAGVGNDVVGWILLALCVALVNAGTGLTALWVLLTCTGYILFIVFAVRPAFLWILRRTGSLQNGPSQGIMALTLLMVLVSSWFTGIIGVHPIFGAFIIGFICPHEGGFAIKLTEKVEDFVSVLFLPLYFALSGLNTNLGLLDSGMTWAYVIGVMAVAFFGKIIGGTLAARLSGVVWRESLTIGALMSCKGLVELIVLNIGLQARILSTRTFTIFVVMALVTTFATSPLTSALYPPWYQKKLEAWKRGEIDWDGRRIIPEEGGSSERDASSIEKLQSAQIRRLLAYLRLDSLSGLFTFISLLGGDDAGAAAPKVHPFKAKTSGNDSGEKAPSDEQALLVRKRPVVVHGVRMHELTERTSSVMKVSGMDDVRDAIVDVFQAFANLNNVAASGGVVVASEDDYADTLTRKAADMSSDLLLIPWGENGVLSEVSDSLVATGAEERFSSGPYSHFVAEVLSKSSVNTAVFVNNGFGGPSKGDDRILKRAVSGLSIRSNRDVLPSAPIADRSHHIFFPYFGGADDNMALRFVLQLAQNANVTATIVNVETGSRSDATSTITPPAAAYSTEKAAYPSSPASSPGVPAAPLTDAERDQAFFASLRDSLPRALETRVVFDKIAPVQPLTAVLERARAEVGKLPRNAGDLVVVGRHRGNKSHGWSAELAATLSSPVSSSAASGAHALGDLAEVMIAGKVQASIVVIQAGHARDV